MKQHSPHPKPQRRRGPAHAIPEHAPETESGEGFVQHPDGWYWTAPDGLQQFGPFETCAFARADRDRVSEEAVDEAEAEREAEQALGVEDAIHALADVPAGSDNTLPSAG